MRYRRLGRTELHVSEVCLGTMTFGGAADEQAAHAILDAAVASGINFIDTADIYGPRTPDGDAGTTERIIGRWLKHQQRDRVIIATKVRGPMRGDSDQGLSRERIMRCVDNSLRRLQTDYLDLYQTHWPDEAVPLEETLGAFNDLVQAGKVRYIGCSNTPAWYLMKALWTSDKHNMVRYESLQPHYNLVHRAEFERELQVVCQDQAIGVIPYSPLAGGFLTGKYRRDQPVPEGSRGASNARIRQYMQHERNWALLDTLHEIGAAHGKTVAQVALAWLIDAPAITAPIIGATSVAQLHETLGAVGWALSDGERSRIEGVSSRQ